MIVRVFVIALLAVLSLSSAAWVLWDQSVYPVEGQEPAVLWNQWGSFTSKAACEGKRREELQPYEHMTKLSPNDWSKQGDAFVRKDNGKVIQRISYYCYPTT